jgi:hypothetical protein
LGAVVDSRYDIFIEHSNGAFAWVESAQDIEAAKQRLKILDAEHPGNYHVWDSTARQLVNLLTSAAHHSLLVEESLPS